MKTIRRSWFVAVDAYRVVRQWARNNEMEIGMVILVAAMIAILCMGFASAAVTHKQVCGGGAPARLGASASTSR